MFRLLHFSLFILLTLSGKIFAGEKITIAFSEVVRDTAGFYIEDLLSAYRSAGLEPVVAIYPQARATHLFEIGKVDALGTKLGSYEKTNTQAIKIAVPVVDIFPFKIYVLKSDFDRVSKLKKPFILASTNCGGCQRFSEMHDKPIDEFISSLPVGLKMLEIKRADLIISSTLYMGKVPGKEMYMPFSELTYKPKIYHFISAKKAHLQEKITKAILEAKKKGAFNVEKLKYND